MNRWLIYLFCTIGLFAFLFLTVAFGFWIVGEPIIHFQNPQIFSSWFERSEAIGMFQLFLYGFWGVLGIVIFLPMLIVAIVRSVYLMCYLIFSLFARELIDSKSLQNRSIGEAMILEGASYLSANLHITWLQFRDWCQVFTRSMA